jgi:cytochrome b6-f complex iron-sulfur subunit
MERRTLLRTGLASILAFFGAGTLLSGCSKEKKPTGPNGNGDTIDLDLNDANFAALRDVGGAMKVSLAGVTDPVLVIRTAQDQVSVLSSVCTHAGCEVGLPQNDQIVCPCHDSSFDLDGSVIQGPATQALPGYPAVIQNQIIYITT